jgi:N-acetylneuraminic acid mutarotase
MLLAILFSCNKNNLSYTQNGNWVSRATFPGIAMGEGASFTINNIAYIGTGINPLTQNQKLNAMYKYTAAPIPNEVYGYDSAYGSWAQIAPFPGPARSDAVGFTIGNTGYLGSGLASDGETPLADFYSYNPGANTWTQIDSISDADSTYPRFDAVAFGFDTTAYVLTGTDDYNYFVDVWRYSPTTNTWIRQHAFPGSQRSAAISFVHQGLGYIATGFTPGSKWAEGSYCYDFWVFTPMSDTSTISWQRLRDIWNTSPQTYDDGYSSIVRRNGTSFLILGQPDGDKAYISTGSYNGSDLTATWEYDFATDLWTEKAPYKGEARTGALGLTLVGNVPSASGTAATRGFIATGLSQGGSLGLTDCYEFFPNQTYNKYD